MSAILKLFGKHDSTTEKNSKQAYFSTIPTELTAEIFSHLIYYHDIGRMSQVCRTFHQILYPLQKTITNALKLKEVAVPSFVNHSLKDDVARLIQSSEVAHIKQLPQICMAKDVLCFWKQLANKINQNIDLTVHSFDELISKSAEFPDWCKKHEASLLLVESLDLSNEYLTTLPPEIGMLINLEKLNLSHNYLTTLPPEFGNLNKLNKAICDDNLNMALIEYIMPPYSTSLLRCYEDTGYALAGVTQSKTVHSIEILNQVDNMPVLSIFSGLVRIVIAVTFIAFNAFKAIVFGIGSLGIRCLSKKHSHLMQIAAVDSLFAIALNFFALGMGLFAPFKPLYNAIRDHTHSQEDC